MWLSNFRHGGGGGGGGGGNGGWGGELYNYFRDGRRTSDTEISDKGKNKTNISINGISCSVLIGIFDAYVDNKPAAIGLHICIVWKGSLLPVYRLVGLCRMWQQTTKTQRRGYRWQNALKMHIHVCQTTPFRLARPTLHQRNRSRNKTIKATDRHYQSQEIFY